MVKKNIEPKIYKVRKVKNEKDEDQLVVRYKNLDKKQLKEFKADVDDFCQAYFKEE